MHQIKARIINNKKVKGDYWRCVFNAPGIAGKAAPGQFLNIRLENKELFLRRPFGIHRINGSNPEILYEVLGKGTEFLSRKKPGEYLDIIGPLGNGFDYRMQRHQDTPPGRQAGRTQILVAGGMGVAPLVFLAEKLREIRNSRLAGRQAKSEIRNLALIGAKTKKSVLCEKEFKAAGFNVKIATDDGSRGFKGYVSELLEHYLSTADYQLSAIYACGPRPMLKEVSRVGLEYNAPVQVSLEEHMACGIGACFGCVTGTLRGYKRVCKDGPVFKADDLIW